MPAPTISHVILTAALIVLVFTVQLFFFYVVDNIWAEMVRRELKELTDYVSDSLANLYFLMNSTSMDTSLKKTLKLPSRVSGSAYRIEIIDSGGSAQGVRAYVEVKTWVNSTSWLPPGLKVYSQNQVIQSVGTTAWAGCIRVSNDVYVWLRHE